MDRIIISLTSMNKRIEQIHLVLESLIKQKFTLCEFKIHLYLSKDAYLLDEGINTLPQSLVSLSIQYKHLVEIYFVKNIGSYRKFLPLLKKLYNQDFNYLMNTLFITCDDDTIYQNNWLETLYSNYLSHQCIIAFRARQISLNHKNKTLDLYQRWHRTIDQNKSLYNMPTGKDGILYHPSFLHPNVLYYTLAHSLAPTCDDLWLKTHSLLLNVPIYVINTDLEFSLEEIKYTENNSLYYHFNKDGNNDQAIINIDQYLKSYFNTSFYQLLYDHTK